LAIHPSRKPRRQIGKMTPTVVGMSIIVAPPTISTSPGVGKFTNPRGRLPRSLGSLPEAVFGQSPPKYVEYKSIEAGEMSAVSVKKNFIRNPSLIE
jgi:hypothetical protein